MKKKNKIRDRNVEFIQLPFFCNKIDFGLLY